MEHEMRHKFFVPNSTLDIFTRKVVYYFYLESLCGLAVLVILKLILRFSD